MSYNDVLAILNLLVVIWFFVKNRELKTKIKELKAKNNHPDYNLISDAKMTVLLYQRLEHEDCLKTVESFKSLNINHFTDDWKQGADFAYKQIMIMLSTKGLKDFSDKLKDDVAKKLELK